jgi:hypothetical protein
VFDIKIQVKRRGIKEMVIVEKVEYRGNFHKNKAQAKKNMRD